MTAPIALLGLALAAVIVACLYLIARLIGGLTLRDPAVIAALEDEHARACCRRVRVDVTPLHCAMARTYLNEYGYTAEGIERADASMRSALG